MAETLIRDLAPLTVLASRPDGVECFIALAGGLARSSKTIRYLTPTNMRYKVGQFAVLNGIDGSEQTLWPRQLWTQSNIGKALDAGALFADD